MKAERELATQEMPVHVISSDADSQADAGSSRVGTRGSRKLNVPTSMPKAMLKIPSS